MKDFHKLELELRHNAGYKLCDMIDDGDIDQQFGIVLLTMGNVGVSTIEWLRNDSDKSGKNQIMVIADKVFDCVMVVFLDEPQAGFFDGTIRIWFSDRNWSDSVRKYYQVAASTILAICNTMESSVFSEMTWEIEQINLYHENARNMDLDVDVDDIDQVVGVVADYTTVGILDVFTIEKFKHQIGLADVLSR